MDAPEISVYGEAKGEYTRQLCVFLTPPLESYFIKMLEDAKAQSPSVQKHLWNFQSLLQAIPDWNQDKVVRETDEIQKDCKCDYLEELLTAVFIAHTKVLSAIRLTTKQKKLQITIPKIDHFLHRVLSDCARSLWANAFLFAETNSIEKQKNLRQVSGLVHESILQAIRGLLPVKAILREYLHNDDEEDEEKVVEDKPADLEMPVEEVKAEVPVEEEIKPAQVEMPVEEEAKPDDQDLENVAATEKPVEEMPQVLDTPTEAPPPVEEVLQETTPAAQPMIYIDTKPSVTFSQEHIMFDSNSLEANEIHDVPFAEAELRDNAEEEEEEEEEEEGSLKISDEFLEMDADEILG